SRRMKSRLGHYSPASEGCVPEIVLSRRHIRRDGWDEALHTLLHEMVHQWQDEQGLVVDHGASFRAKARAVGITPLACRAVA
ncbi:MAG TPA: SprT-like domain-containing protein, partial [Gemmatimonadaceae bacterium]